MSIGPVPVVDNPVPLLLIVTLLLWAGVEAYLVYAGRPTISARIQGAFRRWPPLGFIAGAVFGYVGCHFFGGTV